MSKYHNLPDIDTAPDVFETADEPDQPLRPSNEGSVEDDIPTKAKSELIDQSSLPARKGVERAFTRTRRKDGTYQLGLPPLARSPSSSSDEGPSRPRETPAARIRRLKAEIAEVEKEVQESGPSSASNTAVDGKGKGKRRSVLPPKDPVDLVGELTGLRERLAVLDEGRTGSVRGESRDDGLIGRLKALKVDDKRPNGEDTEADEVNSIHKLGDIEVSGSVHVGMTEFDRRLASLEEMVGSIGDGVDQTATSPLVPSLSKLDHLLTLLTSPRHLDLLSRRLKLLLVDLDRAAASSRRTGTAVPAPTSTSSLTLSTVEHTQLITLFNLLPRLDPLLPLLPPLLGRLRSLAALHREAGDIVAGLKQLEEGEKARVEDVAELKKAVEGVRKGLEESAGRAEKNWEAVQARLGGLEERLKKLAE